MLPINELALPTICSHSRPLPRANRAGGAIFLDCTTQPQAAKRRAKLDSGQLPVCEPFKNTVNLRY
eukprot:1806689-Alexandrium_andersonii.AAC.1